MGEKDLTEKALLQYNDVFADIVNVLIFGGERIISPDDLTDTDPHTYYYDKDKIREQEQDVVKNCDSSQVQFACIGFENQTVAESNMIFRVLGYDGARYRSQLKQSGREPYPVITLVLFYGYESHWNKAKSLHQRLDIHPLFQNYVSDYKINVFDIAYLKQEQVDMFTSDFGIVADYFCQIQRNHCYIPSRTQFQHVQETLHLLAAVTDDDRFETSIINFEREVPNNMCEVIDNYINMGVEKGLIQGIELSRLESIKALMVKLDLSAAQAMNLLDISEEDQKNLKEKLS